MFLYLLFFQSWLKDSVVRGILYKSHTYTLEKNVSNKYSFHFTVLLMDWMSYTVFKIIMTGTFFKTIVKVSHTAITCSRLTMETLQYGVKYAQSYQ